MDTKHNSLTQHRHGYVSIVLIAMWVGETMMLQLLIIKAIDYFPPERARAVTMEM